MERNGTTVSRVAVVGLRLERTVRQPGVWPNAALLSFPPVRAAVASALSLALFGAACGGKTSEAQSHGSVGGATGGQTSGGAGQLLDADTGELAAGGMLAAGGSAAVATGGQSWTCSAAQVEQFRTDFGTALSPVAASCANAEIYLRRGEPTGVVASYPWYPMHEFFDAPCESPPYAPDIEAAIAAVNVPDCWAETAVVTLAGAAVAEQEQLAKALSGCHAVGVELDATGQAVAVTSGWWSTTSVSPETTDCVLAALAGLSFPCLAGSQFCVLHLKFE